VLSLTVPARAVVRSTPRTRIIFADLGDDRFVFHAGQAVFAGLAEGDVRRPYSIACSPGQMSRTNTLELLVQIDDHRAPDPHLERTEPGTLLRLEGPFGSFGLPSPLPEPQLLLAAGGTGIAPLRSIMWDTLERDPRVAISLVYSARSPDEFAYRDELESLAAERRIRLASTVTRGMGDGWSGATGRINEHLIASMLEGPDTRCVICGPPGLVAEVTLLLKTAGITDEKILTETYAA
jgi:ferredoxin-NADP reductase